MKYLVTVQDYVNAPYHNEYFDDEMKARKYANVCYKTVPKMVALYVYTRSGYRCLKMVKYTAREQAIKTAESWSGTIPDFI